MTRVDKIVTVGSEDDGDILLRIEPIIGSDENVIVVEKQSLFFS